MGLLDFLSPKPAAPAPTGATDSAAAPAEALKKVIDGLGLDASRVEIKVDGSKVTLSGGVASTADGEKIALAIGNTKGVTQVENNLAADAPHAAAGLYTVEKGDTLWKIAEATLGKGARYTEIFEANKPMLSDPDKIFPGQVLRIPGGAGGSASAESTKKPGDDIVWKAPTS
jgi:nucleoid-associated protein YgaU